jgi:hypothetical protein
MPTLRRFKKSEIALSPLESWQVLCFFFGGSASTVPGWLTDDDRSFAQALLIEAVDASHEVSWIQSLWRETLKPGASVLKILAKLALKAAKDWLRSAKPTDLKDAKIYQFVRDQLTRNWRSAWRIRVDTDEPLIGY